MRVRWLAASKDRPGPFVLREGRRYSGRLDGTSKRARRRRLRTINRFTSICCATGAIGRRTRRAPPIRSRTGMGTAELRCRLDHAIEAGEPVTLCNAELWPVLRWRRMGGGRAVERGRPAEGWRRPGAGRRDVVMLYRGAADDVDRETPDLFD